MKLVRHRLLAAVCCLLSLLLATPLTWAQETQTKKPHYKATNSNSKILTNSDAPAEAHVKAQFQDDKLKVYQYTQSNGVVVFADHAPSKNDFRVLLYDCYACKPDSDLNWQEMPLFSDDYDELIQHAAKAHKLDPALIRAVIHAESAFNSMALSRSCLLYTSPSPRD